jgi:inorganic phosphate transporter, PiT family
MAIAFAIMVGPYHLMKRADPHAINKYFQRLQILSSLAVSLSHGSNDAQKTMGIITLPLLTAGKLPNNEFIVPDRVALLGYGAIGLGTLAGGWRIIRTMGMRITHLQPINGFAAESAAAMVIRGSSVSGIPVSTTHVVAGSIVGVGSAKRFSAVR